MFEENYFHSLNRNTIDLKTMSLNCLMDLKANSLNMKNKYTYLLGHKHYLLPRDLLQLAHTLYFHALDATPCTP